MNRCVKLFLFSAIIVGFLTGPNAHSQDFDQLMKAVNEIEVNLKALVERESRNRESAIAELKSSVSNPQSAGSVSRFTELESLFSALRAEVNELVNAAKANEQLAQGFERLQSEIETLRAEIGSGVSNYSFASEESTSMAPVEEELVISGFFDITGTYQGSSTDETQLNLGQVEIHIDHYWTNGKYVRITPVWNNSTGNLSLGPVFARFNVHESSQSTLKKASVSAGKLDIPFGIALLENASKNRKIPTRPELIGFTHGGWGDYGVQMDLHFNKAGLVVYAVNGFASSLEVDSALSLSLGITEGVIINTTPSYAFGTRLYLNSGPGIELGTSFATGFNELDASEMQLWGLDVQYTVPQFRLKGEYISHSLNRSIAPSRNRGYYLEGGYFIGDLTFAGRYGSFKPDGGDWGGRVALAASVLVHETIDLKYETILHDNSDDNFSSFQLVSRF